MPRIDREAIFRIIRIKEQENGFDSGSCVFFSKHGYFLTCSHFFEEANSVDLSTMFCQLPGSNKPVFFDLLKRELNTDLAVGRVLTTNSVPYLKLGKKHGKFGEIVRCYGYPGKSANEIQRIGGKYILPSLVPECMAANIVWPRYEATVPAKQNVPARKFMTMIVNNDFGHGFSGAPGINRSGDIIGIYSFSAPAREFGAEGGKFGGFVNIEEIERFLSTLDLA